MKFFSPLLSLLAFTLLSCSDNRGEHVLTESQMVDVLYDYQMADVLAQQSHPEDPRQLLNYRQAVFYKHHISEEEFNHSLAHYSRHPQQMKAVYEGLAHHYNVQANTTSLASGGSTSTDTILVWGQKQYTLSGNLQNRFTLEQPFPLTKKPLESLRLSFLSSSFYHQGTPQLAAALSVIYDNDSVGTTAVTLPLYQSQQVLLHPLSTTRKPRSFRLSLYQIAGWDAAPQMVSLHHLRLQGIPRQTSTSTQP